MPDMPDTDIRRLAQYEALGFDGPAAVSKKIKEVEDDNAKLREKTRTLDERAKLAPKEGERVLTPDQVKRFDAFEALGKSPEELAAARILAPDEAKRLEAFDATGLKPEEMVALKTKAEQLEKKDAARERRDTLTAGFEAEGVDKKHTGLALRLLEGANVELTPGKRKDAAGEEKEGKYLTVTLPGEGQKPMTLAELAKVEDFHIFAPGAASGGDADGGGDREYPPQHAGQQGRTDRYDPVKDGEERGRRQAATKDTVKLALS